MYYDDIEFSTLIGKTLTEIIGRVGSDEIVFKANDGSVYKQYHSQDCCEGVDVQDIIGDTEDLIGSPILEAEVVTSESTNPEGVPVPEYQDSFTWTFYKLATIKGRVTIRWYGESNGYYSESVSFVQTMPPNKEISHE